MVRSGQDVDWDSLKSEIYAAFSPGSPIKTAEELAGREEQARRLRNIMLGLGEHALIYGERGAGKTSIAWTFWLDLNTQTRRIHHIHVNCGDTDFSGVWRKVFRRMRIIDGNGSHNVADLYPSDITPDDVEIELQNFGLNDLPIIQLDEFDKIDDPRARSRFAELIKSLSDHGIHAKLCIIGIADNASELIAEHASISRALKQVKMPRLTLSELEKIVSDRYRHHSLRIKDEALFQIAFLSRGLPYFAHLLGRHAALATLDSCRTQVTEDDVFKGLESALSDVDQTITEQYLVAVRSQRPDETLYEPVLIACALAEPDDLGQFQQSAVAAPLAEISPRNPPYSATTFAFHMNEFCEIKRSEVLRKLGEARNYRYVFSDPMMQPYVIIRALNSGTLKRETFKKFITRRQRPLPI